MNWRIDERVALHPTDWGRKPDERELAVRLHQMKEGIPKKGVIIVGRYLALASGMLNLNDIRLAGDYKRPGMACIKPASDGS
jgi:hypothetical protein